MSTTGEAQQLVTKDGKSIPVIIQDVQNLTRLSAELTSALIDAATHIVGAVLARAVGAVVTQVTIILDSTYTGVILTLNNGRRERAIRNLTNATQQLSAALRDAATNPLLEDFMRDELKKRLTEYFYTEMEALSRTVPHPC